MEPPEKRSHNTTTSVDNQPQPIQFNRMAQAFVEAVRRGTEFPQDLLRAIRWQEGEEEIP